MPSKHVLRTYIPNGYYHIYNRGVEKRKIFLDETDYKMFLYYLFIYLAPSGLVQQKYPNLPPALVRGNVSNRLDLLSYVLMPNHFHMLITQKDDKVTTEFLRRLTNAYTRYFNKRYKRVGSLFQGVFKAILVENDEYLLHLSRYIHQNPLSLSEVSMDKLHHYRWSSYRTYIGAQPSTYIQSQFILNFFSKQKHGFSYQKFVESYSKSPLPTDLSLEDEKNE